MKLIRTAKCTTKFLNNTKKEKLLVFLTEYNKVVNSYVDLFWPLEEKLKQFDLKSEVLCQAADTWLSYDFKNCAARQALGAVNSAKSNESTTKPIFKQLSATISKNCFHFRDNPQKEFDFWVVIKDVNKHGQISIPIKKHHQYNKLADIGQRANTITITKTNIEFIFDIDVGPKLPTDRCVGIDSGIKALATLSTGKQYGTDILPLIEKIIRCKQNSKGQKRAKEHYKQRLGEIAKEIVNDGVSLVVLENLKNITKNTKNPKPTKKNPKPVRRMGQQQRRVISKWRISYFQERLEMVCQLRKVSVRHVPAYWTSTTCHSCGHTDKRNRKSQAAFVCQNCGHSDNADVNAAKNILSRFLTGKYGSGCKPLL